MELVINRKNRSELSTVGDLSINGLFECFTLEDTDRGLDQGQSIDQIKKAKVYAQTAIPAGRYEVAITFSNRFQKYMPLIMGVPGFEGIRIHSGNTAADTEGCILVGQVMGEDAVACSRAAFSSLLAKLKAAEKKEKVFITIK